MRTNFDIGYVVSIKDDLTVDLKRDVLERSMKAAPTTSAYNILAPLPTVYQETIDNEQSVNLAEEVEEGGLEEATTESILTRKAAGNATTVSQTEKIKKKQMHAMIGDNI